MQRDERAFLFDILQACRLLVTFVEGKRFDDYQADPMLRSAVERQFEIVGEALAQLSRHDSDLVERITEYRRIIAFRNILIHGYARIDDRAVWDIAQTKLPVLIHEVEALMAERP